MSFKYTCRTCGEPHEGMPALAANAPLYYYAIPETDRRARCNLNGDTCVIDGEYFFVRGTIEIPVDGLEDAFNWGVWVSLGLDHFAELIDNWDEQRREELGPYFGWLSAEFRVYPPSENLKTRLHLQPPGLRPLIELEPTGHPLAVEQREGITQERLAEIYSAYLHAGATFSAP